MPPEPVRWRVATVLVVLAASAAATGASATAAPGPVTSVSRQQTTQAPAPLHPRPWVPPARRPVSPAEALAGAPTRGPVRLAVTRLDRGRPVVHVVKARDRAAAGAALRAALADPAVLAAAADRRLHVDATNDTYRSLQWGLDTVAAETAWPYTTGTGVVVGVVDTGVDGTHPDLAGQVLAGADLVAGTGDGRVDPDGHGTHVAGIVAAVANNNLGVAGAAPGVKILPVRVLDSSGSGWTSDIANGITYAADHGAAVINLSLGGSDDDPAVAAAVSYAQSRDVVVVAAAGNDAEACTATVTTDCGNPVEYPAGDPGVLAVAAVDSALAPASFSEHGAQVSLAAPGVKIASTYPGASYIYMSGTSMASPFVAASAALVRAARPALDAKSTAAALLDTATDLGAPGRDDYTGAGLVNPRAAICFGGCPQVSTAITGVAQSSKTAGTPVTLSGSGPPNGRVELYYRDATTAGSDRLLAELTPDAAGAWHWTFNPAYSGSYVASSTGAPSGQGAVTVTVRVKVTIDRISYLGRDSRGRCMTRFLGGTFPFIPGAATWIRNSALSPSRPIGYTKVFQFGGSGRYDTQFGLTCGQRYRLFSLISGAGSDGARYADDGVGADTWYTAG